MRNNLIFVFSIDLIFVIYIYALAALDLKDKVLTCVSLLQGPRPPVNRKTNAIDKCKIWTVHSPHYLGLFIDCGPRKLLKHDASSYGFRTDIYVQSC